MDGQEYTNLLAVIDNLKEEIAILEEVVKTKIPVQVLMGE